MDEERLFAEDPKKIQYNYIAYYSAAKPIEKDNDGLLTKDPREKSIVEYFKNKNIYITYTKIPDYYGEFWLSVFSKNGEPLQFKRDAAHSSCGVDELGRFSYKSSFFK